MSVVTYFSMGLPKANRLKRWQDFQSIYQQGNYFVTPALILRALPDPDCRNAKFGISISRKISKKAVIRNRIKRQIRSALQILLPSLSSTWVIVLVVRPPALECKTEHFLRELEQLFIQSGILYGHSRDGIL